MVGLMVVWKDDLTVAWKACKLADQLDAEAVDGSVVAMVSDLVVLLAVWMVVWMESCSVDRKVAELADWRVELWAEDLAWLTVLSKAEVMALMMVDRWDLRLGIQRVGWKDTQLVE